MEATETLDSAPAAETETQVHEPVADAIPAQETPANEPSGGGVDGADVSPGIDEELAELRQRYGFEATDDPKSLLRHLATSFDKELAQLGRQAWGQPQQAQPQGSPPQQKPHTAAPSAFDLEKLLPPELSGDGFDESLVNHSKQTREALKAIHNHYESKLSSLKDEVGKDWKDRFEQLEQFHMQQEEERVASHIDGFFTNLGAEWTGEFGTGPLKAMSPHSQHVKARNAVVEEALAIQAGYAARGREVPELGSLLSRALNSLHGHQQATKARQKLVSEAAAKKTAATSGASAKRGAPLDPKARALATFQEGFRKLTGDAVPGE